MKNKKTAIIILLGWSGILACGTSFIFAQSGNSTAGNEKAAVPGPETSGKSAYSAWGRNPFALSGEKGASLEELRLEGIMSDKAIIDDTVVGVGDKIKGNTVVDIKEDRVILNDGKKDFEIKLGQ